MTTPQQETSQTEFTRLVDLASRRLGASVVAANDEGFAERENLIKPEPARFQPYTFGHKGQVMDGWETRRRREPGHDWAIVRLGVPGVVRGVVVDTAFFTGNYPPEISVEGAAVEGYPSPNELEQADWVSLVPRSAIGGDRQNAFPVEVLERVTHVRLCMYPDGGVARLRVHGDVVADPRFFTAGGVDLAALVNGGTVVGCSNMHYSSPTALISPGEARVMGEGWETARRRDDAHDWVELLPRQRLQPDTRHRFRLRAGPEITHVRLDVFPDGGLARVRLHGDLSAHGRIELGLRWLNALPAAAAHQLLEQECALDATEAEKIIAARPITDPTALPDTVQAMVTGGAP